jgi:inosine-uridine nucleoside N-ribohydrolase
MTQAEPKRVMIDTDPGVDDALALLLALASPELAIEAITTVAGNARIEATTRNALRTLAASGAARLPPVFVGCKRPLHRDLVSAAHVHGEDGLGETSGVEQVGEPASAHAADAMIEIVSRRPGEITLIALGPLTNLAMAILRDPTTMVLTREIIAMGGAVACPGNVTAVAEYNFYADPEAAQIVLRSGIPVTLAPLDATMQAPLSEQELNSRLAASARPAASFVRAIVGRYFKFKETRAAEPVCFLHDPLAVVLAIDRTFAEFETFEADIETAGKLTAGMLVADRRERPSGPGDRDRIAAAMRIDARRFLDLFLDRVLGPSPGL